jgi:hypothetical protein
MALVAGDVVADWANPFPGQAAKSTNIAVSKALFPLLQFGFKISARHQIRLVDSH